MRRVRLRTILALLVLATTLPVAAFGAWLVPRFWKQQLALIDRQNIEQARAISVAVDEEVEATIASLNVLALLEPIDAPAGAFADLSARVLPLHPGWHALRLIDRSLRVVATAGPQETIRLHSPDWANEIFRTGRPAVSAAVQDPDTNLWMVNIGVPVIRGGTVTYVLGARIDTGSFGAILKRQQLAAGGVVGLLDGTPRLIARSVNEDRFVGRPPNPDFVERTRADSEGSLRSATLEGVDSYSAWRRSQTTGWTVGIAMPAAAIDRPMRASLNALILAGVGTLGGALVLALLLGRRIVRVQTAAASAARALARGEPIPTLRTNIVEVDDLWSALRDAKGILDTRLRERDSAQAEADRHRAALFAQEHSARRAAEALNRAKDEFIATVSHELRTPLGALFGWVAMLKGGRLEPERQAHALDVIERNARAQAQLIDDLLDMSRVIRGVLRLEVEPTDAAAALDAAIDALGPTAEARQIFIHAEAPRGVAVVSADRTRLQQILWNVLSNALKFTPPGGRIDARIAVDGSEAVIRISDTGEGIAPEFLPHVFDRFRQESADTQRTHSGLGLGLSLVRHLTELHGGTIAAESGGKGRGSTFTIRLPLIAARALVAGSSAVSGHLQRDAL
jgi:signal transduction histidine kinase